MFQVNRPKHQEHHLTYIQRISRSSPSIFQQSSPFQLKFPVLSTNSDYLKTSTDDKVEILVNFDSSFVKVHPFSDGKRLVQETQQFSQCEIERINLIEKGAANDKIHSGSILVFNFAL